MRARMFVWLGGGLFAAALAYCLWWYVFRLGAAAPGPSRRAIAVDAVLVCLFALHHSVFARESVKTRVAAVVPSHLVRAVYVWTASLLLIAVCAGWATVGGEWYRATGAGAAALAAVQLAGIWLIVRSVRGIDALELAGIRQEPVRGALQVRGPYAWVRHPLYAGWVLAVFGAAHMTGDRLAFAAMTTAYLVVAIPLEERSLVDSFGDDYRRYARAVRWRLIPFIY